MKKKTNTRERARTEAPFFPVPKFHLELDAPPPNLALGRAERMAKHHEDIARDWEEAGDREAAKTECEHAAVWRRLMGHPEDENARRNNERCRCSAVEAINTLLARAEKFHEPMTLLVLLWEEIFNGLLGLAANGNAEAAKLLLAGLNRHICAFTSLARGKRKLFLPLTRKVSFIPSQISPNKAQTKNNAELLETLEVGDDDAVKFKPRKGKGPKLDPNTKANTLALRLKHYIEEVQRLHPLRVTLAETFKLPPESFPCWYDATVRLKAFSAKTWRDWAGVAWQIVESVSPQGRPQLHSAFYARTTKICNVRERRRSPYPTKAGNDIIHTSPSIASGDIKEALYGAFETLATGHSPRSRQRKEKASPTKSHSDG